MGRLAESWIAPPEIRGLRESAAPGKARTMRVNHEYKWGGPVAYLAAYDVHQARVFGRCAPSTGS
jgi:hypothetical protein